MKKLGGARRPNEIGRWFLRLVVAYLHWSIARRTWWSKTLAVGAPIVATLLLFSIAADGADRRSPDPLPQEHQTIAAQSINATVTPRSSLSASPLPEASPASAETSPPGLPSAPPMPSLSPPMSTPTGPIATPAPRAGSFYELSPTEATVKAALSDTKLIHVPFDLARPVAIDLTNGQVLLTYYWDYSSTKLADVVTYGGYAAYNASRILFANPDITRVAVRVQSVYEDKLANTVVEPSTIIVIGRSTADQVSWDTLGIRVLQDNKRMFCAADAWFIHPIVYAALNDKGCLLDAQKTRVSP